MAKLQVFFSGELKGEYRLDDHDEVTIGRAPTCDIVIDNGALSRHHCTLRESGGLWTIIDEGSSNGTYIDGKKISQQALKHKDRVTLGKHTLLFDLVSRRDGAELGEVLEEQPPVELEAGSTVVLTKAAVDQIMARSQKQQAGMALILMGKNRQVTPLAQTRTRIGKGADCEVRVSGLFVKQEQAVVVKVEHGYKIFHKGGLRSMQVNGKKSKEAFLQVGDTISIAGQKFYYGSL
ncbi:FHA domain-containing protein [Methylomagnum sp.]